MQSQRGPFAHHTPQETKNAGFLPMVEPSTTPPPPTYTQAPSLPIGTQPPLQTAYYQPYYAPHPELHRNIELQRKRKGKQMKICLAVVAMCVLIVAGIIVGVVVYLNTAKGRCSEASDRYGRAKACL